MIANILQNAMQVLHPACTQYPISKDQSRKQRMNLVFNRRDFTIAILYLPTVVVLFHGILQHHNTVCTGKKIDSYDLLIGDWMTSVRLVRQAPSPRSCSSKKRSNDSWWNIFSTAGATTTAITDTNTATIDPSLPPPPHHHHQQQHYGWWNPTQPPNAYPRNIPCLLSLYSNGTFGLTDCSTRSLDSNWMHQQKQQPQLPNKQSRYNTSSSSSFLIRGKWTFQTNPYCVTDRFYDTVLLESYPRVLKERREQRIIRRMGPKETTNTINNVSMKDRTKHQRRNSTSSSYCISSVQPIQKVQLKLQCRLSGHFSGKQQQQQQQQQQQPSRPTTFHPFSLLRDRHHNSSNCYARGKMTHGVMTLEEIYNIQTAEDEDDTTIAGRSLSFRYVLQEYRRRRRRHQHRYPKRIVASFSARRCIPSYSDLFSQSNDSDDNLDAF